MNREEISEKYNGIINAFKEGALNKLSIAQLEDHHAFLLVHGSHDGFNESNYFQLCERIRTLIDLKNKEKIDAVINQEIQNRLEELKKPHRASFWLLFASVCLAFVAAVFGILSLPQVQKVVFGSPQSQEQEKQSPPSEPLSHMPKSK